MTADVALRPGPLLDAPVLPEPTQDAPLAPVVAPRRPRLGRRGLAGALTAAALAGAVASPAAAPLRTAAADAGMRAAAAMTLQESDLATLPAPSAAVAPVVPPDVLAQRERGRAAAADTAAGLQRTAVLLDTGQPREALQAFSLAVQALAAVPADEPRRLGLAEQARQVRGRLVVALEQADPAPA